MGFKWSPVQIRPARPGQPSTDQARRAALHAPPVFVLVAGDRDNVVKLLSAAISLRHHAAVTRFALLPAGRLPLRPASIAYPPFSLAQNVASYQSCRHGARGLGR